MRTAQVILWVLLALLVVLPLAIFAGAVVVRGWDWNAGALVAGVYLGIALVVGLLIPLVICGGLVYGLRLVRRKARVALSAVTTNVARVERPVERASQLAVAPDVWLYSRFAWLGGFVRGLRAPRRA